MSKRWRRLWRNIRKSPQRARRWLAYVLTRLAIQIIVALPDRVAVQACAALGGAAFWLLPKYRRRTLRNLELILGQDLPERGRFEVAREVFRNVGRSAAEFALIRRWTAEDIRRRVAVVGVENFEKAHAGGRGVITALAHFGSWELCAATAVQCFGVELAAVARQVSNARLDALLNEGRARAGVRIFFRGRGTRPMVEHLKAGKVLAILVDQDTRKGQGLFVPFLGRPAYTQRGPALLAWRLGVPILPVSMVRNPDGFTHTLYVDEPIEAPPQAERAEAVEHLVRSYTQVFERYIRRYPAQWSWMHDRWRHVEGQTAVRP
ncbi:MAG: lysophospholipid acyltransferase family protein [Candidatus Sumerlaeota bacterium]|nr:lysophospholipid acyltransferase family protein [Candidatus Sumerlaeota bacterium]